MKQISYSKTNDNRFYYIDNDHKLNVMDGHTNLQYTENDEDNITAFGVETSYNDEFILSSGPYYFNVFFKWN